MALVKKVIHNGDGVDITPGKEEIVQPARAIPYEHRDVLPNKAGPTEPKRKQYIPYLMTNSIEPGLVLDVKNKTVYPDIRGMHFFAGVDLVEERKPRPGEVLDGPPPLKIDRRAHSLQLKNNVPVHSVIRYPSDLPEIQAMKPEARPTDEQIEKLGQHVKIWRKYQRQLLLPENMLQLNLNQAHGFSLRWNTAGNLAEEISKHAKSYASDIRNREDSKAMRETIETTMAAFELDLKRLSDGCDYYARLVEGGMTPQAAIDKMRLNREHSIKQDIAAGVKNSIGDCTKEFTEGDSKKPSK